MRYTRYRIYLNEEGRSNPSKVKDRLYEVLGEDIFAYLFVETETGILEDDVQNQVVLSVGIELAPGTITARIGDKTFSDFTSQLETVSYVKHLTGA